ncbi:unnamed protein product [Euphydryas editha]|uniref:LRRCT domain-containing protein n=1 Tax=Euphydryas editha TaxID=104508 RepID=A0AAU9URZ2_EUPED|nr:unnamed protein product [Euphydryas editha]
MDRLISAVAIGIVLSVVNCEDVTTVSPKVIHWNETGICRKCVCKDAKVNCFDKSLDKFFSKEEWTNLKEFKPTIVDLSENPITEVTALAELPVKVLNLSRCSIESIERASFKDLLQMEVLDLSYNKLTYVNLSPHAFEGRYSPEDFEALASMRILNLAYNDLHYLHPDLFLHLPKLTELNINGNPLRTINHGTHIAISSLPKMKVLKMSSCGFNKIPDKLFHTTRFLEHLDISNNKLISVPNELEECRNLKYLNLNQNPIVKLDMSSEEYPGFPRLLKLQELHMCNMEALTSIGEGALAGLENLKKLHISFNPKLSFIDPKALARPDDIGETYDWPLIKELYLQSNNLSDVDFHLVSRWDLLDKVDVSNNPFLCDCSTQWMLDILVPAVESKVVNGSELMVCKEPTEMKGYTMKHLHEIHRNTSCVDKYGNRLEKDGAMSLRTLNDLKEFKPKVLDISGNPITKVTALAELPVKVLNLSRCSIESIENASFKDLQEMEVLDLSYNKLTSAKLRARAFEGSNSLDEEVPLASMRILNLAYNDLHSLQMDLFELLPNLTELNINGNPLRTLYHGTYTAISSLPKMKILKMSSCGFDEIPEKLFHTTRSLEHLDISDNKLTSVPKELEEARNLKYLNLNQNPIVKLDMSSKEYPGFPRLLKLQELHMCNMEALTSIGAGALSGLENLKKLHMSFNPKLSFIDPKALARPDDIGETYDWPLIKELYLQSNNLSDVDFHLVSRWDLLDKVDVSNNPFLCDCSTQWMVDILVPVVESKVVNGSELMVCKEPTEMKGYTMKHLHEIEHTMSCVDKYGNRLEKDGAMSLKTLNATTVPPKVIHWNETGICRKCICKDAKVNCFDKSVDKFFSKEEWTNLKEFKPTIVDLSENPIIEVTALAELPVKVLNLSRCSIESIERASFKDLQQMEVLDLSYNKLTYVNLSPHAFEGRYSSEKYEPLASMRTLNLEYNDLHSLNQDLFEHLPELTELNLNGNPLTTIDLVTLIAISSLPMLKVLKMRSCGLTEIPEKFLHTPKFLEHLDISDNKLISVPEELKEARNLKYLNLNQNPIVKLDMSSKDYPGFPRLRKLQELHMSNMKALTSIGAGALSGLVNLKKLHMSFNPKLSFIDPKALARPGYIGETYDWPLIKELYLQSNNLPEVDFHLVFRWDSLDKVDVSNNPFLCDCSTQWMLDILVPVVESKVVNGSELMVCKEPIEMKGYTMKHLHEIHRNMSCVDQYGNRLEIDVAMLLGTLIGVLLAVPIMFTLLLLWRRGLCAWMGLRGPKDVSNAFYKRAPADDNYI